MRRSALQMSDSIMIKVAVEPEASGGLPWWAPLVAGGLAGGAGYGLARTSLKANMSKYPVLRKIQDAARGKMVRPDFLESQVVDPSKLSRLERLKRSIQYGPEMSEGAIAANAKKSKDPMAVWQGSDNPMKGTFNPALGGPSSRKSMNKVTDRFDELEDKLFESQLLEKYAPGTSARTLSLKDLKAKHGIKLRRGKNFEGDLAGLQNVLKKEFGKGFIMKSRGIRDVVDPGVASSGVFPTDKTNFRTAYKQWQKMRPEFMAARKGSSDVNPIMEKFRTRKGFEGRIFEEMPHNNVVFQERLPLKRHGGSLGAKMKAKGFAPSQEYRVHMLGGKVIPSMAMQRYPAMHPLATLDLIKARRAGRWAQKNVVNKLPKEYRDLSYGMDIAPLKGGGYRVIETNPGGMSGLLDNPLGSHGLYKGVTGRHTKPVSALMGAGAGIAGAGATAAGSGLLASQQQSRSNSGQGVRA